MNSTEVLQEIFKRLRKYKILILSIAILFGLVLFFYANSKRPVYTAKATIFPLTNNSENSLSPNTLSGILGLVDASKSFSNEATINIIELSLSRFLRESVATTRLPAFGNKTITELLIQDFNSHKSIIEKELKIPADSMEAMIAGAEMLKPAIAAKMNKNGILELYFSNANSSLISPVSFVLIDKLSQFYIDLKIKKARDDYNFTVRKIDSLDVILNRIDKSAIRMQHTTLFAPSILEYDIPKEKINADKQRYVRQRDMSLNNQEEALWRLQKLTPIISVLDKPTEPFTVNKPSAIIYAIIGFVAGCVAAILFSISGLLFNYTKSEMLKSIFGSDSKVPAKS